MSFHLIGPAALSVLTDLASNRVAAREDAFVASQTSGEIERVAWLRASEPKRRIDASLLTENYAKNWSVRAQGAERERQAHLLQRTRRSVVSPGRRRMD